MTERVGVVVAQLGGPRDETEVAGFIRAVFADPDTVALPGGRLVRRGLAEVVARVRGPKVRRCYRLIGGGSPILPVTQAQARLVEDELRERGIVARASVAMRHGRPDTEDAVRELVRWGADRLVLLPLYPQECKATTGSAAHELERVVARLGVAVPVSVVRSWHDTPSYVQAQAELLADVLPTPAAGEPPPAVLFCAHGVPERLVREGDPYVAQVRATVDAVAAALPIATRPALAFQSRTGPVRWVGPDVRDEVRRLGTEGERAVCLVPISFVSDHVETLYELDVLVAGLARDAGVTDVRRAPTFNDDPAFGRVLADVMEDHLCTMQ